MRIYVVNKHYAGEHQPDLSEICVKYIWFANLLNKFEIYEVRLNGFSLVMIISLKVYKP